MLLQLSQGHPIRKRVSENLKGTVACPQKGGRSTASHISQPLVLTLLWCYCSGPWAQHAVSSNKCEGKFLLCISRPIICSYGLIAEMTVQQVWNQYTDPKCVEFCLMNISLAHITIQTYCFRVTRHSSLQDCVIAHSLYLIVTHSNFSLCSK